MNNELTNLTTALCLPKRDIEALVRGRTVAATSQTFVRTGQEFALYPYDALSIPLLTQNTQLSLVSLTPSNQLEVETLNLEAWASCIFCRIVDTSYSFKDLAQLTQWTADELQEMLERRKYLFLVCLRVHQFAQPIKIIANPVSTGKLGKFVGLPSIVAKSTPALDDRAFAQRKRQLENLEPPEHPELEELHRAIALLAITNPDVKAFVNEIESFLGWADNTITHQPDSSLDWISEIATLGNRSKEQDEGKSNYQAGTDFENVVRDSLEFLGFKIDYSHKGGAGGLDLFCSAPYPLVGECKAGKKIPNDTAVQLLNLGTLRLQNETLLKQAAKLIIGPGEPTNQLEDAAKVHHMAIINPETLEKLVKLQNQYRGSVDLLKLKDYLKPGRADDEVEKYIDLINQEIKLRSHIIQSVKEICESDDEPTSTEVKTHYNARFAKNASSWLNTNTVRDLLVELSSPLTGYLGRKKGSDGNDRFYFLRDLHI
jgi:hypothetical protein